MKRPTISDVEQYLFDLAANGRIEITLTTEFAHANMPEFACSLRLLETGREFDGDLHESIAEAIADVIAQEKAQAGKI